MGGKGGGEGRWEGGRVAIPLLFSGSMAYITGMCERFPDLFICVCYHCGNIRFTQTVFFGMKNTDILYV